MLRRIEWRRWTVTYGFVVELRAELEPSRVFIWFARRRKKTTANGRVEDEGTELDNGVGGVSERFEIVLEEGGWQEAVGGWRSGFCHPAGVGFRWGLGSGGLRGLRPPATSFQSCGLRTGGGSFDAGWGAG
jgi:hypothetical protein